MGDGISLQFDELRDHARKVDRAAGDLDDPIGAITSMTLGGDAYGVMCSFAIPPTTALGVGAAASLTGARGLLRFAATTMRSVVDDWEEHESDVSSDLDEMTQEVRRV